MVLLVDDTRLRLASLTCIRNYVALRLIKDSQTIIQEGFFCIHFSHAFPTITAKLTDLKVNFYFSLYPVFLLTLAFKGRPSE